MKKVVIPIPTGGTGSHQVHDLMDRVDTENVVSADCLCRENL